MFIVFNAVRDDKGNSVLLAQEKGMDIYTKVDDSKCQLAINWWKTNKEVWKKVRTKWEDVFGKDTDLSLQKMVKGKPLYADLFSLKPDARS